MFGGCFREDYEKFVARPYWTLVDPLGLAKSQSCSELWEGYNLVAPEKI